MAPARSGKCRPKVTVASTRKFASRLVAVIVTTPVTNVW
jgi:hypothetical protein